jgi:hypothetical protein
LAGDSIGILRQGRNVAAHSDIRSTGSQRQILIILRTATLPDGSTHSVATAQCQGCAGAFDGGEDSSAPMGAVDSII